MRQGSCCARCPKRHRSWPFVADITSEIETEIRLFPDDCVCYCEISVIFSATLHGRLDSSL